MDKIKAILEVFLVFASILFAIVLLGISSLGRWERSITSRYFFEYMLMILIPLLLLVIMRREFTAYGISLKNLKYHINIAGTCFIPVAVASMSYSFLNYRRWDGAVALVVIKIALLFVLAFLLRKKLTAGNFGILGAFIVFIPGIFSGASIAFGKAISTFIFYFLFLGPGEEILFRGYIQSRLNRAFGRPYRFFGVKWGMGLIIASFMFGLMHVLNVGSLINGHWEFEPWWGVGTVFSGLVLGFVREKTGSIVAPAILHGLPQAIAYSLLGM